MTPTRRDERDVRAELDRLHHSHGHADHDGLYNEDVAHESADVTVRGLLIFCFGLVAVTAVVQLVVWGTFVLFERQAAQNDPVVSPLAVPAGQLPPEPRLLTNEPMNLEKVRAQENQVLGGYAWVDQKAGTASIPIDEAKKRLLHDGLPSRATPVDPSMGTYLPARGEASGGRNVTMPSAAPGAVPPPAPPPKPAEHKPAGPGG